MDGLGAAISPLVEVDSRAINQIIERMMTIWDYFVTGSYLRLAELLKFCSSATCSALTSTCSSISSISNF